MGGSMQRAIAGALGGSLRVMTVNIYYDGDCPAALGERVAILGYGSQGHAHAQNLKDSGADVRVGLHAGSKSRAKAERHGLRVLDVADAVREADVVMVLTPDVGQAKLYRDAIESGLEPGSMLMFAHGFSIHFGQIEPPQGVDVTMIAPKAPGHLVRSTYVEGTGTPALVAIQHDATGRAKERALAYARALGAAEAGVLETTFKDETETDLFGEQSVLCGGIRALITAGVATLVEAGYPPQPACSRGRRTTDPLARVRTPLLEAPEPARTAIRAGYQGEPGAYSEEALLALFPGADPVGHRTFTLTVDALLGGAVDVDVIPVENTL